MRKRELGRRKFLEMTTAAAAMVVACRPGSSPSDANRLPKDSRMLQGKICLVTGATSGMGAVTALELARLGATVVVAGRSADKCAERAETIRRETGARVETAVADMASQDEVRTLASDLAARFERLDLLVNNAGAYVWDRTVTVDGLERTFAVNYLSHFLLTNLLLDRLRASPAARIVNVTSSAHRDATIEFDNLQGERGYERLDAYARSKLALLMFTYELARRLKGSRVMANAVHPGAVATNIGSENGFFRGWLRTRVRNIVRRSMLTPEEGARSILYVASSPDLEGVTGRYYDQGRDVSSSPESYDEALARRLWDVSAELCALPSSGPARSRSTSLSR